MLCRVVRAASLVSRETAVTRGMPSVHLPPACARSLQLQLLLLLAALATSSAESDLYGIYPEEDPTTSLPSTQANIASSCRATGLLSSPPLVSV